MASVEDIIEDMEAGNEISFSELLKVCVRHFGAPRNKGSSHFIFKTPWIGNPRINIQSNKGNAKPYQVRQVLAALARLRTAADEAAAKARATTPKPDKFKK